MWNISGIDYTLFVFILYEHASFVYMFIYKKLHTFYHLIKNNLIHRYFDQIYKLINNI